MTYNTSKRYDDTLLLLSVGTDFTRLDRLLIEVHPSVASRCNPDRRLVLADDLRHTYLVEADRVLLRHDLGQGFPPTWPAYPQHGVSHATLQDRDVMASADDGGHHALVARTSLGYRQVHDGADPGGTSEMALSAMPRATGHGLGSTDEMLQILLGLDKPVVRHSQTNLGPLVNWRGGGGLPIHRWFRYREGFSPALIGELGLGVRILDPFCGSGSIMVGSAQQSRSAVGIDVNPLAAFVASVKLTPLKDRDLKTAANFGDRFEGEMEHVEPWPASRVAGLPTRYSNPTFLKQYSG